MSITVKHVTKSYGSQLALNDVSFSIPKGQIAGFLGPNGAGKSTMMKILTAYIPPTLGTALVNDLNVQKSAIEVKKCVGYLPEHNPLYLDMYVREFLSFFAGIHGKRKQRVEEVIEETGLAPEVHKRIGALSKGYRQRVGLAHALLHEPDVLILDEPTTGLDPNQIVEIRSLIRKLGKDRTVMLSTHIMQEVDILCDRVLLLSKGQIVADKQMQEIRDSHTDLETMFRELTA